MLKFLLVSRYHPTYPPSHYGSYYPPPAYAALPGTPAVTQPYYRPPPAWGNSYYPPPQIQPPMHPPGHYPPQTQHVLRSQHPPQYKQPSPGGLAASSQGGATAKAEAQPDPADGNAEDDDEVAKKQASLRFEMVLNQIDVAKQRVKHEKDTMKLVGAAQQQRAQTNDEQLGDEPNALMDDNDDVTKFEERPPGDDGASEFSGVTMQGMHAPHSFPFPHSSPPLPSCKVCNLVQTSPHPTPPHPTLPIHFSSHVMILHRLLKAGARCLLVNLRSEEGLTLGTSLIVRFCAITLSNS